MGSFADSVKANTQKILVDTNAKVEAIVEELFTLVVNSTPVLDGYLINSWYTMPNDSYSNAVSTVPDTFGGGSKMSIASLMQGQLFLGKDGTVTMTNNQPYAHRIEYLGWSKFKAPYGMRDISLQQVAARHK